MAIRFDRRRMQQLRKQRGWSLTETAEKLEASRQAVLYLERGDIQPSAAMLGKLAAAFEVDVDTLYLRTGKHARAS